MFAAFFDSHGNNSKMLATTPERSVCALAGPPPPHKHVERPIDKPAGKGVPIDKPAGKGGFSAKAKCAFGPASYPWYFLNDFS
jgi:hypothetical protein